MTCKYWIGGNFEKEIFLYSIQIDETFRSGSGFFYGDSRHSLFLDNSNVVEIVQIYTNLLILFSSLFIYNTYIYIINPNKLDDRGIRKEKRAKKLYKIWTFLIWLIYITSNKSPVCEYVVASCHNMLMVAWNLESRSLQVPAAQTHQAQDPPHCTRHHTIYLQRLRLARPPFLITFVALKIISNLFLKKKQKLVFELFPQITESNTCKDKIRNEFFSFSCWNAGHFWMKNEKEQTIKNQLWICILLLLGIILTLLFIGLNRKASHWY